MAHPLFPTSLHDAIGDVDHLQGAVLLSHRESSVSTLTLTQTYQYARGGSGQIYLYGRASGSLAVLSNGKSAGDSALKDRQMITRLLALLRDSPLWIRKDWQ